MQTRTRRILRWSLVALATLLVIVVGSIAGVVGTEPGRLWLTNLGLNAARNAGVEIRVDGLATPALGHWQAERIALQMNGEPMLDIHDLELRWAPSELLRRQLHIERLHADAIHYSQPSGAAKQTEPPPEQTGGTPALWPVYLDELSVNKLRVQGLNLVPERDPPPLRILASAELFTEHPVTLQLDAQSLPEGATQLHIDTRALSPQSVEITGELHEPPGGWLAALIQLPQDHALEANFDTIINQDGTNLTLDIERLALPLFDQALRAQGVVAINLEGPQVQTEALTLWVNEQPQAITLDYQPEKLSADLALDSLSLDVVHLWVPELERGTLSGDLALDWALAEENAWPDVEADIDLGIRYQGQQTQAQLKGALQNKRLRLAPSKVQLESALLTAQGAMDFNDGPSDLRGELTDFNTQLLEPWPVPLPESLKVTSPRTEFHLTGHWQDPDVALTTQASGRYREEDFTLDAEATGNMRQATIRALQLKLTPAEISATGTLDWTGSATDLHLDFSQLDETLLRLAPEGSTDAVPEGLTFTANGMTQINGALSSPSIITDLTVAGRYPSPEQDLPYRLNAKTQVQVGDLEQLELVIDRAWLEVFDRRALSVQGHYNAKAMDLKVTMERLPTRLLEAFGWHGVGGEAEADLRFQGTLAAPQISGFFNYRDRLPARSGRPERWLSWRNEFNTVDQQLNINSNFQRGQRQLGQLQLSLPLQTYLQRAPDSALALELDARGNLDLAALRLLLDPALYEIDGTLALDMRVRGNTQAPQLDGTITLENGEVNLLAQGIALHRIAVTLRGQDTLLTVEEAVARDASGGKLALTGHVDWGSAARTTADAIDLTLEARRAQLLDREDIHGELNGSVAVTGSFEQLLVAGEMGITPLEIDFDAAMKSSIPQLDVTEVQPETEDEQPSSAGSGLPEVRLDLVITADQQAHLRGRGLVTELAGRIKVYGTLEDPRYDGRFRTVRGRMELFGKRFILQDGEVLFSNDAIGLRIPAIHKGKNYEFRVELSGTVDDLKLALSSDPTLPEDEILSQLLFGKSVADTTPFEALQLASAVRSLTQGGGGFDPVNSTRKMLGVDTLTIDTEENEDQQRTDVAVGIGKYVDDNVYLEVKRSTNEAQPWEGSIEVQLTPRISAEGGTGETGAGEAQIMWKKDY